MSPHRLRCVLPGELGEVRSPYHATAVEVYDDLTVVHLLSTAVDAAQAARPWPSSTQLVVRDNLGTTYESMSWHSGGHPALVHVVFDQAVPDGAKSLTVELDGNTLLDAAF